MPNPSPRDIKARRVAEFAACELMLDMLFTASVTFKQDLESVWIIVCVMHNTMRNVITNREISPRYISEPDLPDSVRLSISRRAIADKTGLSRETVRRRTNRLIEEGILEAEANGNVRLARIRHTEGSLHGLNQIDAAVRAYTKRLHEHQVQMPLETRQ